MSFAKKILSKLILSVQIINIFCFAKCPNEQSSVLNSTVKLQWKSKENIQNQIVTSKPSCLNDDGSIITRTCVNGSWYPPQPPLCEKFFNGKLENSQNEIPSSFCPLTCNSAQADSRCFCKSSKCESLATVENFQDLQILQKLAGKDFCRVGYEPPEIFGLEGLKSYLNKNFWRFGDLPIQCSICEANALDSVEAKLVLSFEEAKKELDLLVYQPEGVKFYDDEFLVFCYTNAAKTNLKEKVDIDLVFKHVGTDEDFPNSLLVYRVDIKKYMGEYWCDAFSPTFSVLKSEKVIAYERKRGNEYTLRIIVDKVCKTYSCNIESFFKGITKYLQKKVGDFNAEVRAMEIFNFDSYNDVADVLLHISTGNNNDIKKEYYSLLRELEILKKMFKVKFLRSSEFCLPEKTYHHDIELNWPLAKISDVVVPKEFCLLEDGTPVVRQCQGDFLYGAVWANITGNCVKNPPVSKITEKLHHMVNSSNFGNVLDVVRDANLTVLDIYYLNTILEKLTDGKTSFDLIDKVMDTDEVVLEKSQNVLNLTDHVLDTIEMILESSSFNPDSVYFQQKSNFLVHICNPFLSNISGLSIYKRKKSYSFVDFTRGSGFEDVSKTNLELSVYIPEPILDQIANETQNNVSDVFVITVVFYDDRLFVDNNFNSGNLVISVTIPGFGNYLRTPIPILFKSRNHSNITCGFWDNGLRTHRKKGEWSILGSNHVEKNLDLHECSYVHLTHFALLLMSDRKNIPEESEEIYVEVANEYTLEVLTIIGCSFSGFGILGIFLTAIFFERWRRRIGTKILLHLSIAILLEITCIQLSEIKYLKASENVCKIIGVILHYVVLSQFCWMLVYALLQYYRFVRVIGAIPKNLILKSIIFGWGFPLGWVFIVGLSSQESYASSTYELCYPRGLLLYVTVIVPICLIMIANIIIFCLIMYNITHTQKTNCYGNNNKLLKLKLYLALLLFSVLGIPWIFGLLAMIISYSPLQITLYYIFCISATLQGFILFLFYVVLNKETREFWLRLKIFK